MYLNQLDIPSHFKAKLLLLLPVETGIVACAIGVVDGRQLVHGSENNKRYRMVLCGKCNEIRSTNSLQAAVREN